MSESSTSSTALDNIDPSKGSQKVVAESNLNNHDQEKMKTSPTTQQTASSMLPALICAAVAGFGGIVFGYDSGSINGVSAMLPFKERFGVYDTLTGEYRIDENDWSLIVSILSAGTFFGALAISYVGDLIGRRNGIFAFTVIFTAGCAIQTGANNIASISVGRAIAGVGVGGISGLVPMYQGECSPKQYRGAMTALYQFAVTLGLLLAACVAQGTKNYKDEVGWRLALGLQILWAIILIIGLVCLPESPRFYVRKGQDERARKSLCRLRRLGPDHPEIYTELNEIKATLAHEMAIGEAGWLDCFKPNKQHFLRRTLIGMAVQVFQQFTGINFIMYFSTQFFESIGIQKPFLITLATNIINCFSTPVSFYTVEKFGRRSILIWGALAMCICEFIIAIVNVSSDGSAANNCLIAFTCIYIFFFATTWGPAAWILCGEVFPLRIRSKGTALSTASNWFMNWLIAFITPYLVGKHKANLGAKVFFIWGSTTFFCFLFALLFVPEMKGLSLEEIDELFENYTNAWSTTKFRPQGTFAQKLGMHEDKTHVEVAENV